MTDGVDVGLLVHNVGGGASFGPYVESTLEAAMTPVLTNCVALTKLIHRFGKPMAQRGRGGILIIGSLAGNAGSYFIAGYSAAKAFNQVLAEALWTELQPQGVHVLVFPIGSADTPSRRRSGTQDDPNMQWRDLRTSRSRHWINCPTALSTFRRKMSGTSKRSPRCRGGKPRSCSVTCCCG